MSEVETTETVSTDPSVTLPPIVPSTVEFSEKDFAELCDQRHRVERAKAEYDEANEEAKSAKKTWESARETFERMFDRFARSGADDLPLFNSQNDAIASAQADPIVTKLADRLIARGHDVNLLIVAGYTEEERNEAAAYLDRLDARDERLMNEVVVDDEARALQDSCIPPAFLLPQPLTPIEVSELLQRIAESELTPSPDASAIERLSRAQVADVRAWLDATEQIKADKGDAVTFDDLPAAPAFLLKVEAADDTPADEAPSEHALDVGDEPEKPKVKPKKRSKRRTNGSGR